jgi:hypothetical protein
MNPPTALSVQVRGNSGKVQAFEDHQFQRGREVAVFGLLYRALMVYLNY